MDNLELLKQLGLEEKESLVYLALLELGTASVYNIASKSGLKRPTTYLILDALEARGLVSQLPQTRKTIYIAESPEKLALDLRKKEEMIRSGLPALLALHNTRKDKPQVRLYQGKNGVEDVYREILLAKEVRFFAAVGDALSQYGHISQDLIRKAEKGEITIRELLSRDRADVDYSKSIKAANYEQRFAQEGHKFFTDNALFEGKIAFFSFRPLIFAVVISSQDIYESLSSLFEMAWQQGEKIDKVA